MEDLCWNEPHHSVYGVLCTQVWTYYQRYPYDKWNRYLVSFKLSFSYNDTLYLSIAPQVAAVWYGLLLHFADTGWLALRLFETIDQAFIAQCVYYYTVTNYMNPVVLLFGKPIWWAALTSSNELAMVLNFYQIQDNNCVSFDQGRLSRMTDALSNKSFNSRLV